MKNDFPFIEKTQHSYLMSEKEKELTSIRNQLAEAQNKADDDWLNRIAIFWKGYTGKQWDVKDGEHREEGIASNLVVIFDEMHALREERDQLKQQLSALTEALKPVRVEHNQSPCPIAEAVSQKVIQRAHVGFKKYGTNAARTDLPLNDWLNHLQEELLDAAVYVERLKPQRHH